MLAFKLKIDKTLPQAEIEKIDEEEIQYKNVGNQKTDL